MLRIYNTLTRGIEEVVPLEPGVVRMYTCGPTVYRYAHIGNLRTYLMADWLRRALEAQEYQVIHIKNITDVGHMRQELLETGGDKMVLAALAEGKTPQEIAQYYAESFHRDEEKINILPATHFPWASQHIPEMLEIIQQLFARGYAYEAGGNIYFNVDKLSDYGKLSGNLQEGLMEGVRVEVDPLKRDPRDFTLWKMAEPGRDMKWDSPWGEGFPGWHIECSAMAKRYLGEELDIHTGGVDNIFPHHEDEIAQSEGAFGKRHVRYWVHSQHLLADGAKMAKSAGNVFTLDDLEQRGFDPLAFRYLCLTAKFNHRLNFTFSALKAAQRALTSLRNRVWRWSSLPNAAIPVEGLERWRRPFFDAVEDNLDLPGALAITWKLVRSEMAEQAKLTLLREFDNILGLGLDRVPSFYKLPNEVETTVQKRTVLRSQQSYPTADQVREELFSQGYIIEDDLTNTWIRPKTDLERREELWKTVSSSREVDSLLGATSTVDFSVIVTTSDYLEDVKRCVKSVLYWVDGVSMELIVVDNGSTNGIAEWLEDIQRSDGRVRVIHSDHFLGEAAAKNIALKQSLGSIIVNVDTSVEVVGDLLGPIQRLLRDESVGLVGRWGLRSDDLHHFHEEIESGEIDAMQAYCFAFRRNLLNQVGLMRECFRFYRNLDIDVSFQFKDKGYRILADPDLPVVRHEHRVWSALGEAERNEMSQKNFRRFLDRWGHRKDLLVVSQETDRSPIP